MMYNPKTDAITYAVRGLNNGKIIELLNDFFGERKIAPMECFDDFCNDKKLSFMAVAEAVHDGDFHSWHDYFCFDNGEFTTGDDVDDVYDYLGNDDFAQFIVENYEPSDIEMSLEELLDSFCDENSYDRAKLINHPNWDGELLWSEDWDDVLDLLDIEEDEVKVEDED